LARFDCLECVINGTPIKIPVRDLDRVIEFSLTPPPPLAPRWLGGLGVLGEDVCASLALSGKGVGPRAACRGLLFRDPRGDGRYVVQVDAVGAIVSVEGERPATPLEGWPCPERWLVTSVRDEQDVLRLDTDAVAAVLFGESAATAGDRS
jgi:hypothetical protein